MGLSSACWVPACEVRLEKIRKETTRSSETGTALPSFIGLEGGVANCILGILIETEANRATGEDFLNLAIDIDDCVVEGHSGDTAGLREIVGGWVDDGDELGFLVDGVLMEYARFERPNLGLCSGGLVIEFPEVRHGGDHAVVNADGEGAVESIEEELRGVRG